MSTTKDRSAPERAVDTVFTGGILLTMALAFAVGLLAGAGLAVFGHGKALRRLRDEAAA